MRIRAFKIRIVATLFVLPLMLMFTGWLNLVSGQTVPLTAEDDTQMWHDVQTATALSKEVDFNLFGTVRLGRDVTHLVDRRVGAGFTFKIGKYLTLAPWYLNSVTRPSEGRKGNENRLNFAATVRFPAGEFTLSDRNLFERRLRFPLNSTRYRNRFQIEHGVKPGGVQLGLFASDEVFYDWSVDDWVRNRFTAGMSRRFNKHLTADLYYMRQNDGRSRPGDLHVIGVTYRLRL
jgi:hypothetical protein